MIRSIQELEIDFINTLSEYQVKKNPFSETYVYIIDGAIVGFLDYSVIYERMEINYIFVLEEYRRQGIALKLIQNMMQNHDWENITLEVNTLNNSAIYLYKKLGFEIVATRPMYYDGVDAYLMERRKI